MPYKRLTPADLEPSDEEKRAARVSAEGGAGKRSIGSTIGSVAGGALGALGFLGGPALGAATMGAGVGLGGSIGGEIGGAAAEDELAAADETLSEGEMERRKRIESYRLRQEALDALLSEG